MKLDQILRVIHDVDMEGVKEVEVPTKHLVQLRAAYIGIKEQLRLEAIRHSQTRSEALGILANQHLTRHFDEWA